ncbi:helix-hairpin-helix domain-containing protein [Xylocopilactobacillus apicola]|uniref:Transporter n=1 Tax=Xylocopilactobacillus apicola TaxID=2932184 RepID=A0AAU9CZ25_9LACO|nr:helix-hairpin-helix domain-containing protein [Xylocopilactobacillus apicola]BDR59272.1 transporter [Xylocopilactobacillus apicola]
MKFKKVLKKYYLALIAVVLVLVVGLGFLLMRPSKSSSKNDQLFESKSEKSSEKKSSGEQFVEIKGAVVKPGIYPIGKNTRLAEILKKAGGATPEADLKTVNLAKVARDQDSFYIPQKGEAPVAQTETAGSSPETGQEKERINLNTADLAELQKINGVGAKKAEKIIEYREANGGFRNIEDLKNIGGIGDKTFEALEDQITVSD